MVTFWPGCMRASWVSLKFAVTQISSVSVTNIRVCPGSIREPSSHAALADDPVGRRVDFRIAQVEQRLIERRLGRVDVRLACRDRLERRTGGFPIGIDLGRIDPSRCEVLIVFVLRHHLPVEQDGEPLSVPLRLVIRRVGFASVRERGGIVLPRGSELGER